MADNYIQITTGPNRLANKLRETVDSLARYHDTLKRLKSDMDQMTDGAAWATVEAQFGIPAGKGQTVYNLVTSAINEMDADTNYNQLLSWLGANY